MRFWTLVSRALRLRCPVCGEGQLFKGLFVMHPTCPHCGIKYEREPGFFLGSIYINYGITALIVAIGYPVLLFNQVVAETPLLIASVVVIVIIPILIFRHSRSLWLGFDEWYDSRAQYENEATKLPLPQPEGSSLKDTPPKNT